MKKPLSQHTDVYVLWCCEVKSGCVVILKLSLEQRVRHLPTLYCFFEDSNASG